MARTKQPRRSHPSSTNSPRAGELPELDEFAAFCAELTADTEKGPAPFLIEDFQRTILRDYFLGARETLVLLPKKNGKSTLVAALALHHLLTTDDAECFIAAASREQAGIILKQARKFISRSEPLSRLFEMNKREIHSLTDEGVVRVLASDVDTADGVIPTLAVVDELHRHKSADLYGVFRDGLGPRNGRMITISTAGDYEDSPLGRMRTAAYSYGIERDGAYRFARSPDGSYVMHEWALDTADDLHDMAVVKTANPASWQTEEALRIRHDSASTTSWQWARFACGVWVQGEDAAISPEEWHACAEPGLEIPAGEDVWIGIDLGWKHDTTAIVPYGEGRVHTPAIIVPPRDGTSLREDRIKAPLREFARRWNVVGVVIDPNTGGEQLAEWIEDELGLTVIAHSQDPAPMSLAAERLMAAIREREIRHPGDPALNAHVLAGQRKTVSGEKWRFVRPKRGARNIDALIALAMVHSVATANTARSVYEGRDLLTV